MSIHIGARGFANALPLPPFIVIAAAGWLAAAKSSMREVHSNAPPLQQAPDISGRRNTGDAK